MNHLLLDADSNNSLFLYLVIGAIAFVVGIWITRMVFSIDKIVANLELQNKHSLMQIRLLKKMLINQGTPIKEIDDILENGNKTD